jgi:hypothetical protein
MPLDPLSNSVANRYASVTGGSEEFITLLQSYLNIGDRAITFRNKSSLGGGYDDIFINFSNVPKNLAGGAVSENNRAAFWVRGFGKDDPHSPPPTGKVKIEAAVSALPREYSLRAKTGTPAQVAKYLADFLNKVVKEVEPRV